MHCFMISVSNQLSELEVQYLTAVRHCCRGHVGKIMGLADCANRPCLSDLLASKPEYNVLQLLRHDAVCPLMQVYRG